MLCERATYRESHGRLLADHQTVQNWIADSAARDARGAADDAARRLGRRHARASAAARKRDLADQVLRRRARCINVVDRALQIHGALGYSTDLPLEAMYRYARGTRFYDGADELHRAVAARLILRGYEPPADGVPREHVPTRRAAAEAVTEPRSAAMSERWFDPEELEQLSRPTMDRAIEAIDAGDLDERQRLCDGDEARVADAARPDGRVACSASSPSSRTELGDEGVAEAWEMQVEQGWRRHHDAIQRARPARSSSTCSPPPGARTPARGVGEHPGALHDHRGRREGHVHDEPLRLGPAARAQGPLRVARATARTREAHDWSYGRKDFPLYCTHCTFMNESMPIQWSGYPLYPSDPPEDYTTDPCTWYWYKDPDAIPERHWERYGAVKP